MLGALIYFSERNQVSISDSSGQITNFEDCAGAGYPLTSSHPAACTTPDGRKFFEHVVADDELETLSRSVNYDGFDEPRREVIYDQVELERLWSEWSRVNDNISSIPPLPDVDFSREMVIAVFSGTKGASGYDVLIDNVSQIDDGILVEIVETVPSDQCVTLTVLTYPHHIIKYAHTPAGGDPPALSSPASGLSNVEFTKKVVSNC